MCVLMYVRAHQHTHTPAGTWDYTVPTGGKGAGRKGARKGAGKGAQDGKGAGKGAGKLRIAAWMRGTLYPIRFLLLFLSLFGHLYLPSPLGGGYTLLCHAYTQHFCPYALHGVA